jgi:lipopolysaccharide transport system ATP-binding protein
MYRLGVINNGTLWQDIQTYFALKFGKEDPHSKIGEDKYSGDKDHFWALKDISFDVKQGDRLGIIGKNGAGKSTLLKILSRITTPTEGTVKIKGKVASLLEVGTGFHGELTGRENIYLNGAILGMKKRRIDEKLDSIIEFSGIEQHIDTPVKRYSSGMYVRLAFAVAAHLDSDILIADEVLAVGDAEFQKKALGKMQDLSTGEGRTVLFVSHNMGAVKKLCENGMVLEKGKIKYCGNINDSIMAYSQGFDAHKEIRSEKYYVIDEKKPFQVEKIEILNKNDLQLKQYEAQDETKVRIHCISREPVLNLYGYFALRRQDGESLIVCDSKENNHDIFNNIPKGRYIVDINIQKSILAPGEYYPYLSFSDGNSLIDSYLNGPVFTVVDTMTLRGKSRGALTALILDWNIVEKNNHLFT